MFVFCFVFSLCIFILRFRFSFSLCIFSPRAMFSFSAFGKHLKLGGGGHDASRALFLKNKGAFSKIKRTLLCLLQNLGGTCP